MRALRILGLADNGTQVVCEEPDSGAKYRLPADERLNAAARGDLTPVQRTEPEMHVQLRPKDIQARVRAGAGVAELAELTGSDPAKIERFAYPVLMERGAMAERARAAHPIIGGLPDEQTIDTLVTRTLAERGQLDGLVWDAYREESGQWVLLLRWTAGRSENTARWAFQSRATGSTLNPLDEGATELFEPAKPLRTVRDHLSEVPAPAQPEVAENPQAVPAETPQVAPAEPAGTAAKAGLPTAPNTSARKGSGKPVMPSWEDVLLGVRSNGR